MEKVLAFFGAFNPPTKAHVELAKFAAEKTEHDRVIFIPSKSEYITTEQKKNFSFSDEERLDMLYEVYEKNSDWMLFTDHDILSETQPRSYETLKWLRDEKDYDPTLLIGADQFFDMEEHWKNVPEIAKEFGIIVLTRRAFSIDAIMQYSAFYKEIKPHVQVIETPKNTRNISSSWIRNNMLEVQERLRYLKTDLTPEIYDYIKECYLYEI